MADKTMESLLYRAFIQVKAHRLDSMDSSRNMPDPYAVLKTWDPESSKWVTAGKTERLEDTREPEFKQGIVLPFSRDQEELLFRVEVYDYIHSRSKKLIGSLEYNLFTILDSDDDGVRAILNSQDTEQPGEVTIIAKKYPIIAEVHYEMQNAPEMTSVRIDYKMATELDAEWLIVDEKLYSKEHPSQNVIKVSLIPLSREKLLKTQLKISLRTPTQDLGSQEVPLSSLRSHLSNFPVTIGETKVNITAKLGTLYNAQVEVKDLNSMSTFKKSDPFAVLYMQMPEWTEMGRTETRYGETSCKFDETFLLPFFPNESKTSLLVRVFDRDNQSEDLNKHDLCGQVELDLSDVSQNTNTVRSGKVSAWLPHLAEIASFPISLQPRLPTAQKHSSSLESSRVLERSCSRLFDADSDELSPSAALVPAFVRTTNGTKPRRTA